MMAAAEQTDSPIDLLRLVLSLVQLHADVPAELQRHFLEVVREARSLNKDPEHAHADISPEAVQLAYQVKLWGDLAQLLEGITDFRSVGPDVAQRLLEKLEPHPVG
jgi:hypothetical protein